MQNTIIASKLRGGGGVQIVRITLRIKVSTGVFYGTRSAVLFSKLFLLQTLLEGLKSVILNLDTAEAAVIMLSH